MPPKQNRFDKVATRLLNQYPKATQDRAAFIIKYGFGGLASVVVVSLGLIIGSSVGHKERVGSESDFTRVHIEEASRMNAFNTIASSYDREIGMDEFFMGLTLLRRWVMRQAIGDVLEVGTGTGRNLTYYSCKTLTCTDQSQEMLDVVAKKLPIKRTWGASPDTKLRRMSTNQLDFPDSTFDTVVSTFGLCSYEDPIAALKEMQRVCKPDGRILLLEHGQSYYDFINRWLASSVLHHAKRYGCVWNKPIGLLVDEAGLDVLSESRWHFGTTYVYTARPSVHSAPRSTVKRGVFTAA